MLLRVVSVGGFAGRLEAKFETSQMFPTYTVLQGPVYRDECFCSELSNRLGVQTART